MKYPIGSLFALITMSLAYPANAQDVGPFALAAPADQATVFDGDWLSVGAGAAYGPSYAGSDDYVIFPMPIVQGSVRGVGINPRPAGLALDFLPDGEDGPGFNLGIAARMRSDRASRIKDDVVKGLGKLDRAVEIGPSVGVKFPQLLNPYDSLSFNVDLGWDVAGGHGGMVASPSVTYFTPVSRGAAVALSGSAEYGNGDFARYYYAISPADSAASGLPEFAADGGFHKMGVTLLGMIDLNGDITDGGFGIVLVGGYSRILGDGKRTPFTSIRGDANQWLAAAGIGYTF